MHAWSAAYRRVFVGLARYEQYHTSHILTFVQTADATLDLPSLTYVCFTPTRCKLSTLQLKALQSLCPGHPTDTLSRRRTASPNWMPPRTSPSASYALSS